MLSCHVVIMYKNLVHQGSILWSSCKRWMSGCHFWYAVCMTIIIHWQQGSAMNGCGDKILLTAIQYGNNLIIFHKNDGTWVIRHIKSSTTRLFVQQLVQASKKENFIAPNHSSFYHLGIKQRLLDSPHKGDSNEERSSISWHNYVKITWWTLSNAVVSSRIPPVTLNINV